MTSKLKLPRRLLSLPLAIAAVCLLILINEMGYARSSAAVAEMAEAQRTRAGINQLLQLMLDAETGQRGFLLTGDLKYLQPYERANADIANTLDQLRRFYIASPPDLEDFSLLSRHIQRKLAEIDVTVRLRRQGNEDAWKFVVTTDVGQEQMDAIRTQATRLIMSANLRIDHAQERIGQALQLSRVGIAIVALAALLAFHLYLRQSQALREADAREQRALERERARLEQEVRERTASLAELATHLQDVREAERGHLARELHDELGALLTAAKLDVARLKSRVGDVPEVTTRLQHLTELLNNGIALKRRIIEDLRPSSLANLGLVASLEILAREFGERSGVDVQTTLEPVTLGDADQLTVYRLVQESLTNVGKYAHATEVGIALKNYGTHVTAEVHDNGQGFSPAAVRPGTHGLAGMRHRVEATGGKLSIVSAPGQGTRVIATVPAREVAAAPSTSP